MNFAEIQSNVENYLLDLPDETQAAIPGWINEATRDAERRFNWKHMEAEIEIQTVAGVRELVNEPLRYKEGRGNPFLAHKDGDNEEILWASSLQNMLRLAPESSDDTTLGAGKPQFLLALYDEYEDDFELHCYPLPDGNSDWANGEYRIRIPYWRYTAEGPTLATNWFSQNLPYYLIFKAAAMGFEFNRDEQRAQYWERRAEQQFKKGSGQQKRARLQGNPTLSISMGAYGPGRRPKLGRGRYRRL